MEAQKKKFDDYRKDMLTIETRIRDLTVISEKLKVEHRREYEMIQEIIKRLTEKWEELQRLSEKRQQSLESAQEIQKQVSDFFNFPLYQAEF